jgi:hypothetical protein
MSTGHITSVPLTGGSGIGALLQPSRYPVVQSTVTLTDGGIGYEVGNALSASNTNLVDQALVLEFCSDNNCRSCSRDSCVYSTQQVDALISGVNSNALAFAVSLG